MVFIHRKTQNCTLIDGVRFYPGMNTISDSEFAKIKDTKAFKEELARNMVVGGTVESETTAAVDSSTTKERAMKLATEIRSITLAKAIESITNVNDAGILKFLKEIDGRKGVQEAIDKRMIQIKAQEGDDLKPETVVAPNGDGSDFAGVLSGKKEELDGTAVHSAIPAIGKK
jgi:hypothetical protein